MLEKFSLGAVAETVGGSGVSSARSALCFAYGSKLDVGGIVQKVVKRGGACKLVIDPDVSGFIVFADCTVDAESVVSLKIRKGSLVRVRGRFASFGAKAVCLFDCRLTENCDETVMKVQQTATKKRKVNKFNT
jgi:hypothetical protein